MSAHEFTPAEKEQVLNSYLSALIWSETDEHGDPLDAEHGISDLTTHAQAQSQSDVDSFLSTHAEDIRKALSTGYTLDNVGHDFALTRNHHGAGFWDRGLGSLGIALTAASDPFGEAHLFVDADGRLDLE